jgi:hypothetical protein
MLNWCEPRIGDAFPLILLAKHGGSLIPVPFRQREAEKSKGGSRMETFS